MERKGFSILFALLLVLSFSLVTAVPVAATTTYTVDDDWQVGSLPYAEDTDGDTDFATIQAAIDAAISGDTINVAAGTYSEWQDVSDFGAGKSTGIMIDKSLTLEGANAGIPATGTRGPESIINAQEADMGVLINGEGTIATFDGFTVENYDTAGILAGAIGYWGEDPEEVHILNNIVKEPTIEAPHNNNMQVYDGTTGTIIGNEVSGAWLEDPDWSGSGILVGETSDVVISDNYVHDCEGGIQTKGYAVYRDSPAEDIIIENNLVENCETGISPQGNSINTIIRCNDVLNNDIGIGSLAFDYSWEQSTPSGTEVHYNNIDGNVNYGVESSVWSSGGTGTVLAEEVDAECNWWGSANGPTHPSNIYNVGLQGDDVSDNVDFCSWLNAPYPGGVCDWGPVKNLNTGEIFCSIQSAIDDDATLDGHTIEVAAGTYDEEVVIDKSLTLISNTGDYRTTGTILNGSIALSDVVNVTIQGFKFQDCSSSGYKHVIYTGGTADNITIVANSFDNCEGLNIHIYKLDTWFDNWTITDNKIYNVTGTKASGIWIQRLRNSIISNNEISNTTYAGMILDRIESVTVSNNNISNTPKKGIQVASSPNCNVVIENNYITNTNTSHDADEGAITIYPDVTNIHIENNTLIANYQGFTVRDKIGIVSDVYVNFNNIYGNDGFGVGNFAQDGGTVDATNNWWGDASGPYHWIANTDGLGNAVSDNVDFDPWITGLAYTGDTVPQQVDSKLILQATLSNSAPGIVEGQDVEFYIDGISVGSGTTNVDGIAMFETAPMAVGVYNIKAVALAACLEADALLAVYDPEGGFVTGGGWIDSPPGAYMPGPAGTVIVTPANVGVDWFPNDTRNNGYVDFVNGPETPPLGSGSLEMGVTDGNDKAQLFNYDHMGTPLADIESITYATYRDSSSTNPPAQYPAINIEVDYVGDGSSYTTLVWEPIYAYGQSNLALNTWQTWDTMAPSQTGFGGGWWSTKTIPGVCEFNCFVDWETIVQNNPNAKIKYGFGVNVGSGWNGVFTGAVDALTLIVNDETTTYDFEPVAPPTGKATFGFVSKYKKGASVPEGNTEFVFRATDLNFHSSSYDWLVVTGSNYARFKGIGTINGAGDYKFMLWAGDDDPDTFRIKIWEEDESGNETVIYDNGMDQAIGGGSIVVHTK